MGKRIDTRGVYTATGGKKERQVRAHRRRPELWLVKQDHDVAQRRLRAQMKRSKPCKAYYRAYHKEMIKKNPNITRVRFLERATRRFCGHARSYY